MMLDHPSMRADLCSDVFTTLSVHNSVRHHWILQKTIHNNFRNKLGLFPYTLAILQALEEIYFISRL